MRKYWYLPVAVGAALLTVFLGSPASATVALANNVLTYGSLAGNAVAVGHNISSGLKTATTANFYSTSTGTTGVKCAVSSFVGSVVTNPAVPGTATAKLNTQTFSSCTENINGVNSVVSVTVNNLPYNVSVSSATKALTLTGGATTPIQATVVLNTLLGNVNCVYRANLNTLTGATSNTDNSIQFTNQQFNKFSGPSVCFTNAFFTARYAPVRNTSVAGSPLVFVNP